MHEKVVIHLDFDYFYAQVEEVLDQSLKSFPVGVQQGNITLIFFV